MRWQIISYEIKDQYPEFYHYINSGESSVKPYGETMSIIKLFKTHIKNPDDAIIIYGYHSNAKSYSLSNRNILRKLYKFRKDYNIKIQYVGYTPHVVISHKTKTQDLLGKI